jgi:phosphoenolpyruvate carboxykinase (GTP)
VLKWIIERLDGTAEAVDTPIGYVPTPEALDTDGLDLPADDLATLLEVDVDTWKQEAALIPAHFESFGEHLPAALWAQYEGLVARLDGAAGA